MATTEDQIKKLETENKNLKTKIKKLETECEKYYERGLKEGKASMKDGSSEKEIKIDPPECFGKYFKKSENDLDGFQLKLCRACSFLNECEKKS